MTYSHPVEVKQVANFTVVDEYTPVALAAIELLRQHPVIDAQRVFLLGHSSGGTVAPRITVSEPSIAGLVLLAGGAIPCTGASSDSCAISPRSTQRQPALGPPPSRR